MIPAGFHELWSTDRVAQNAAYQSFMAATRQPVDWADAVWEDVVAHLSSRDSHDRAIAGLHDDVQEHHHGRFEGRGGQHLEDLRAFRQRCDLGDAVSAHHPGGNAADNALIVNYQSMGDGVRLLLLCPGFLGVAVRGVGTPATTPSLAPSRFTRTTTGCKHR